MMYASAFPLLVLAALVSASAGGQARARVLERAFQTGDSAATLHGARNAQAGFEGFRRLHLPERDDWGNSSGMCDLHFGRYCFWFGDDKDDSVPEPAMIREERAHLLDVLARAAARLPGDDWIAGQRVRYLVEDRRSVDAIAVARECRGTAWWCAVLAGFALHASGDFGPADSAFQAAVRAMPDEEACRWRDISVLLPSELRRRYEGLSCAERAGFESRWWWLAAPQLARAGNDRRTEHFARLTLAHMQRESQYARREAWGDDIQEILMRFGPEVYWTRRPLSAAAPFEVVVTGHERVPAFHFVPSAHAFEDLGRARTEDWAPNEPHPSESYAPAYADRFVPLNAQVAAFRRGDSCLVAGIYDVSADPMLGHQPARSALVLASSEQSRVVTARDTHLDGRVVLTAMGGCDPELLSLEIAGTQARWVARLREGIAPPSRGAVSDVLLLDPSDSIPRELEAVLPHALASTRVPVGRVGLFWEVSGLDPEGEPVRTSLAVTAEPRAWLGRAVESIGLARRHRGVQLQWDEELRPERGVAARALDLDLSALSTGRYRLELAVSVAGGAPVMATRELELVER